MFPRSTKNSSTFYMMKHGSWPPPCPSELTNHPLLRERTPSACRTPLPRTAASMLSRLDLMGNKGGPKKRHLKKKRAKDYPRILSAVPSGQMPRCFHQFSMHPLSHAVRQPRP